MLLQVILNFKLSFTVLGILNLLIYIYKSNIDDAFSPSQFNFDELRYQIFLY